MKFSEMPYQRPDIPALREKLEALRARIEGAQSADEAERAYRESDALSQQYATATSLAYIRHSIDTRDAFYDAENAFADENEPVVKEMAQAVNLALLRSPFRKELEARLGERALYKPGDRGPQLFAPEPRPHAGGKPPAERIPEALRLGPCGLGGRKSCPLPKLGPYKQSRDRATRQAAPTRPRAAGSTPTARSWTPSTTSWCSNRTQQAQQHGPRILPARWATTGSAATATASRRSRPSATRSPRTSCPS